MLDVTEDAKEIMKAVRDINNRKSCNLTLVFLTQIFKGSDLKKIRDSGLYPLYKISTIYQFSLTIYKLNIFLFKLQVLQHILCTVAANRGTKPT